MPFEKEKRGAKKDNQHAAKGIQPEPINSASYAAVARRGLVATEPPDSYTDAGEETMEDYEGGREQNDIVPPSAAGEPTHETLTNFNLIASHPLSCSYFKPGKPKHMARGVLHTTNRKEKLPSRSRTRAHSQRRQRLT